VAYHSGIEDEVVLVAVDEQGRPTPVREG